MSRSEATNPLLGRRRFVTGSLTFGAGIGLLAPVTKASSSTSAVECQASAADSLILYLDLLRNVQSQAFTDAAAKIIPATTNCYITLDSLYEKVLLLQKELRPTRAQGQIQEMQRAVEMGKAQMDAIRTSFAHSRGASALLGQTLDFVRGQVSQAAQDMLPAGKITLSPKAKKLLEEVMVIVSKSHDVPQQTQRAVDVHQQRVNEIATLTNAIRDDLFAASEAAADADFSSSPAEAQRAKLTAAQKIEAACTKLEQLKPKQAEESRTDIVRNLSAADLLIKILRGTEKSVGNLNASIRRKDQAQVVNASFVTSAPGMASNYSRVQAALDLNCPRGTPFRTLHCLGLILGALAYPDPKMRIPLISGVLVLFPCASGNRARLASDLANI